jgi:hypothetical protein
MQQRGTKLDVPISVLRGKQAAMYQIIWMLVYSFNHLYCVEIRRFGAAGDSDLVLPYLISWRHGPKRQVETAIQGLCQGI